MKTLITHLRYDPVAARPRGCGLLVRWGLAATCVLLVFGTQSWYAMRGVVNWTGDGPVVILMELLASSYSHMKPEAIVIFVVVPIAFLLLVFPVTPLVALFAKGTVASRVLWGSVQALALMSILPFILLTTFITQHDHGGRTSYSVAHLLRWPEIVLAFVLAHKMFAALPTATNEGEGWRQQSATPLPSAPQTGPSEGER